MPPDPTLNPDNLLKVTRGIPHWDDDDSYICLDMPRSLHHEVVWKFYGEGEEKKKCELFTTWLTRHPCPTWDHVERLLRELVRRGRGREGAAEEVKETYLKSELHY